MARPRFAQICPWLALLPVLMLGCTGASHAAVPATFTPAPSASAAAVAQGTHPRHPVVSAACLNSLSSYRFVGTFALQAAPDATPAAGAGEGSPLAGSLANLLGSVSFRGSAQAPDRYDAEISFGGSGVQPVEIRRIGAQTYSRFGSGSWTAGNALAQFGPLAQLDPGSFCQTFLSTVDAGEQTPRRETVNGIASLRYELNDARIGPRPSASADATPSATATGVAPSNARLLVWSAERGGFPVRFQFSGGGGRAFQLSIDVTDVNGKDVRIVSPA